MTVQYKITTDRHVLGVYNEQERAKQNQKIQASFDLESSVVYDIECLPNVFTLDAEGLNSDWRSTWEISEFRDDRRQLLSWFDWLRQTQTPMIGFNNLGYDYLIIHYLFKNPGATYAELRRISDSIITDFTNQTRWKLSPWPNDRFAPQVDLMKVHHFDNKAKMTSLKALQINMRSENVVESTIGFERAYTETEINVMLIPYNQHDVTETKRFAHISMEMLEFRRALINDHGIDVLNFNDSKIGSAILAKRLGRDLTHTIGANGKKQKRQTFRRSINLQNIIFPYISFNNPEFNRVLNWMKQQTLTVKDEEIGDPQAAINTKGVFKGVTAHVGGMDFHFGTGGIHGSVSAQAVRSDQNWMIRDIDVASLYPSIAIVNRLAPEHLGEAFVREYQRLPAERKQYAKGTYENGSLKLAANGTYGNSNNKYSEFYDPKFTMTITINGQLMLCMLAERLVDVPTVRLLQANTDGITYMIRRDRLDQAKAIEQEWERFTLLVLEDAEYNRMWLRDVNNYIAESAVDPGSNAPPKYKTKGAYWFPDPLNYADSITKAGPPAWHKDFNPVIVQRAAYMAMVQGLDPAVTIPLHADKFDFMLRAKVRRSDRLMWGDDEIQKTSRYYVSKTGRPLRKVTPPAKGRQIGQYRRAPKVSEAEYNRVMAEIGLGVWDSRIHTKNKSVEKMGETQICSGRLVTICNDASHFNMADVDFDFYISEARKLIIN